MWSMMKQILASGHWKQCLFCRQAFPTRDWKNEVLEDERKKGLNSGEGRFKEVIEASGYCTYCESNGLR
jgi:hypothetical protein